MGSSSYISDANGEVTQHLEYFAFGETFLEEHSNADATPYLFNGKELDEETGLYYYGARYYDAKTSVWASVDALATYDPIMNEEHYIDGEHNEGVYNSGNNNPYTYCYHNPIRYVDPNGKQVDIVDFIPVIGSGRDVFRGIRDGDTVMLTIGIAGLAADVYTLGGASVAKGIIKAGVKTGVEVVTKEAAKESAEKLTKIVAKGFIKEGEKFSAKAYRHNL